MVPRFSIPACCLLLALSGSVHSQGTSGELYGMTLVELLEFIGEFTTEDGRWLSPEDFLADDTADTEAETRSTGTAVERGQMERGQMEEETRAERPMEFNASATNASE